MSDESNRVRANVLDVLRHMAIEPTVGQMNTIMVAARSDLMDEIDLLGRRIDAREEENRTLRRAIANLCDLKLETLDRIDQCEAFRAAAMDAEQPFSKELVETHWWRARRARDTRG